MTPDTTPPDPDQYSDERYRSLFDQLPLSIFVWKFRAGEFHLTDFNRHASDETEGRVARCLGVSASELFGDAEDEHISDSLADCHRDGRLLRRTIFYAVRGGHVKVGLDCMWIRVAPDTVMVITANVDQHKRAEHERVEPPAELARPRKRGSAGDLAGGVVHDFNNLLASILGFSDLALDKVPPDSDQAFCLRKVKTAGLRARDLVAQILTSTHHADPVRPPVKPAAVIGEVLDLIRSSLPSTINVRDDLRSDAEVLIDPTRLRKALLDLCTNGARAIGAEGGDLEISLLEEPAEVAHGETAAWIVLAVCVSGEGITAERADSVFDADVGTGGVGKTSGPGLAEVEELVESSGGHITVTSQPHHRSVVTIRLRVTTGTTDQDVTDVRHPPHPPSP